MSFDKSMHNEPKKVQEFHDGRKRKVKAAKNKKK